MCVLLSLTGLPVSSGVNMSTHRHALDLDPVDELREEFLPHVPRQLGEGGQQGGLEEGLGEVLVQHVAQGDRLGFVNLERWSTFLILTWGI